MFKFILFSALIATTLAIDHQTGSEDAHAQIESLFSARDEKGFNYNYETTNHIKADANGDEHGNIKGGFEWISPEGVHVAVKYVADENGYQPESDALPTPPPIPEAILKSLEYIRTHPAYVEKEQKNHGHY